MLETKYKVVDNTWQEYPSAVSIQQLIQTKQRMHFEPEYAANSLVAQIALSIGKDINLPSKLSEEEFQLIYVMFNQAKIIIDYLKETLKLEFDITFKEQHFWLLDNTDQKLLSGFFHNLLINKANRLGVIIKQYWAEVPPVPIAENKELQTLALIAAEAFKLESIAIVSLWAFSDEPSLYLYTYDKLALFKEELYILLKQIS